MNDLDSNFQSVKIGAFSTRYYPFNLY